MSSGKSKHQLTKNIFSLTIVQIATYVLPLISVPVISRIIGPGKYGVINFAAAYITYFTLLITYSFDFTASRRIAKDPNNQQLRNTVFSEIFYTQCFLFVCSTLAFAILLYVVPEFITNRRVIIFSYLLCISTLFTQNWLFQAMEDLSKIALFNLISKVLFTVAILVVVRKNEDYVWQPFLIGFIQTVVALWSFVWAYRKYNIRLLILPFARCLQILWEEKVIFFSLVFVNLYSSTNTVILGLFQSAEQVGYYTSAQRLIIIAQSVLAMPLAQAFYPFIGKAFVESRESGLRVSQKLIPLIVVFIGFASVAMFLLGPFVIRMFYGHKFEAAIPAFQILAIVPLIFSLNNVLGIQIMLNMGMDKDFFKVTAYAGLLSMTLNLLMIKRWGYIGTTINWLVTEVFIFITMYIILKGKGLNPINLEYFKPSFIMENLRPLTKKFLPSNKS